MQRIVALICCVPLGACDSGPPGQPLQARIKMACFGNYIDLIQQADRSATS